MEKFRGEKIRPEVVVTGEAVALPIQCASLFLRVISSVIDLAVSELGVILTVEIVTLFYVFTAKASRPLVNMAQLSAFYTVVVAFWVLFFPALVETCTAGRSLGKYVSGTRVVRDDGGSITFRHAFIRALLGVAEFWVTLGAVAILTAAFNRRSKRLGDFFAGTYVIAEPQVVWRQPLLMAPELAQWAATARVGEIDAAFSVMARRFLQNAARMQPSSRRQAAMRIAAELEPSVYPPPPPRTDPERFIAAVLVLRRDLEYAAYKSREGDIAEKLAAVSTGMFGG